MILKLGHENELRLMANNDKQFASEVSDPPQKYIFQPQSRLQVTISGPHLTITS